MIETRYLQYFLAVAKELNITRAAESLHISQPTLSKQMMDLEDSLGCKLFIRNKKQLELTEDGLYLRSRAQEMMELMAKTESAFSKKEGTISGDIYIGCAETPGVDMIIKTYEKLKKEYPDIRLHLYSGDAGLVMERLEKGLDDFGLVLSPRQIEKFDYHYTGHSDPFGILMRKDDAMARLDSVPIDMLYDLPLFISHQTWTTDRPIKWNGLDYKKLNITATFNLIYNASYLVENRLGYAITTGGKLIPESDDRSLTFRPLDPELFMDLYFVTKKYHTYSPAAALFMDEFLKLQYHHLSPFSTVANI